MSFTVSPAALVLRPASQKPVDASAVRAVAQAAINVELFTIPLYMGALYSIVGTHQITSPGNAFYQGRLWPGLGPTAKPANPNERAFNIVFSVFIEEMLHLQIAANVASAIQAHPDFTSPALQSKTHGWTCYGPKNTILPHIVDLRDTRFDQVKVNLAALSRDQLELFFAIEEPEEDARKAIKPKDLHKYFPTVPFKGWTVKKTETDLPMFGTIGTMYQCYWDYLNLKYDDGTTLIDEVFKAGSIQNDIFNATAGGYKPEYPGFSANLSAAGTGAEALPLISNMLSAITDQGEGSLLKDPPAPMLMAVEERYRANRANLEADYPGATDSGGPAPSPDAAARADNDKPDHYERYVDLMGWIDQIETWPQWFASGKRWTAAELEAPDYDPTKNPYGLPSTQEVADAINRMAYPAKPADRAKNYKLFTQASIGGIAGVTTVLDSYWNTAGGVFPYPAMSGSGDRMGICWAVFGEAPDLSIGLGEPTPDTLKHSCQSLSFDVLGNNSCADVELFHACRGSNNCKAQGGCGFVQPTTGGGLCGHFLAAQNLCGGPSPPPPPSNTVYSAPSDNKCGTFGGCAVPISASQLLNSSGNMELFDFTGPTNAPAPIAKMPFTEGERVHDVAYRAYRQVMQHRGKTVPETPPPPDDLRLIFIPST